MAMRSDLSAPPFRRGGHQERKKGNLAAPNFRDPERTGTLMHAQLA